MHMLADYFYWQYVWAPRFLLQTMWNLQRALLRFFSVRYMLRTLLAYWHKDAASYQGGTLSKLTLAFTWNIISRLIGFIIRISVLVAWLITEIVYVSLAATIFLLFMVWPVAVLTGLIFGIYGLFV
ncbi:MAG: hypothetical protein ABIH36_00085 [bacterium]